VLQVNIGDQQINVAQGQGATSSTATHTPGAPTPPSEAKGDHARPEALPAVKEAPDGETDRPAEKP
jgi:hypothetical protein